MNRVRGFTLPELVAAMVIMGVLGAVAAPRLFGGFDEAAFAQETVSALRYAQRSAMAMQRTVCVTFTATSLSLKYLTNYGDSNCTSDPSTDLPAPGGGPAPYVVNAQHGGSFLSSAAFSPVPVSPFSFARTGVPGSGATITLNNGIQIVIEAQSGYVH
jgi:MSHA pilin protein MshC